MKLNRLALIVLLVLTQLSLTLMAWSQEAEVLFFDVKDKNSNEAIWIKKACDLLGIRFLDQQVGELNDPSFSLWMSALASRETAILTDRSINGLSQKQISLLKGDIGDKRILVLVTGSDPSTTENSAAALNFWSENGIGKIRRLEADSGAASLRVVSNSGISRELGGFEYPLNASGSGPVICFELQDSAKAESLIEVAGIPGQQSLPIFLRTGATGKNVFFLAPWEGLITGEKEDLIRLLPLLMFLKYSFREWTWHGLDDLANLTIDDPWLREPYGYISFRELCQEAEKAPFHATISFVPYNYRRSHDDAIEIFRRCRQNLSVAVHGNDHDFSEFRPVKAQKPSSQGPAVVSPNEKSVLQALYRMDTFSRETGIPYDRVMIFPRANYNEESLGLLKKHNFLMTVNWGGPSKFEYSRDHVDHLREISLEFKNFPVLRRFQVRNWRSDEPSLAEAKRWIQLRLFLDLPVLLYTHHDYFKIGAQAFNSMAGLVNTLQPRAEWSGLGPLPRSYTCARGPVTERWRSSRSPATSAWKTINLSRWISSSRRRRIS